MQNSRPVFPIQFLGAMAIGIGCVSSLAVAQEVPPAASKSAARLETAIQPPTNSPAEPLAAPAAQPATQPVAPTNQDPTAPLELEPASAKEAAAKNERWSFHFQSTSVTQVDDTNIAPPYEQPDANGFDSQSETRTSFTATGFFAAVISKGFEFYVDPELSAGTGLSNSHGIAGFPNGEIYRVDAPGAKLSLARLYFRYTLGAGGEQEELSAGQHQLATRYDEKRISLTVGKFSLNDFFDGNRYSHDPRTQFLNWSLMDNGAWDYAADTRGYTWGFMLEWNQKDWAIRFASVLEPLEANQLALDTDIARSRGDNLEFEYRYHVNDRPGKARMLAYMNHADMGSYQLTLENAGFKSADITDSRAQRVKYGFGLNLEQEITDDWGAFMRLGWNDGMAESWAFTEVDQTASVGLVWKPFTEREDRWGAAFIANGLSPQHRRYLEAGGRGFILGEGGLNYALEQIFETYYLVSICEAFAVSADYQLVNNAGYNQDRSGISVGSVRLHVEL